jgi:2-polyprenyl-3-methyl-5-hydroxy-6-metoxy-1,4-benzoquinol methylase
LIGQVSATTGSAVIDIGGGGSRLVDNLVNQGFEDITVLDLSEAALATAKGSPRRPERKGSLDRRGCYGLGSVESL